MQKEVKKEKASVLAVTLIILGLVLSIALSTSLVSILGNKASISSNKSNLAYSRADSGVEVMLLKIKNADPDELISSLDNNGTCDGIINEANFKIELKDANGELITDCSKEISSIRAIKSTGIAGNNQRAIEVAVAAEGEYQTSCTLNSANLFCCRVNQSSGAAECKRNDSNGSLQWGDSGEPFSSSSDGVYSISCSADNNYLFCCRTNASSGEVSCRVGSGTTWTDFGGSSGYDDPSF